MDVEYSFYLSDRFCNLINIYVENFLKDLWLFDLQAYEERTSNFEIKIKLSEFIAALKRNKSLVRNVLKEVRLILVNF